MSVSAAKSESKIGGETQKLEVLLSKVAIETLKQVFKEDGANIIFVFITNNSHLKLEEITENLEVFSAALEKLLGSGAPAIEILILKSLYHKLRLNFVKKKGYKFSDYIIELRKRFDGCARRSVTRRFFCNRTPLLRGNLCTS